jgi:uncharacterized protein (TIGR02118 family)
MAFTSHLEVGFMSQQVQVNVLYNQPAYYRVGTLIFSSQERMMEVLGSPEGQAVVADLQNFATGGHVLLVGPVDSRVAATA